MIDFLYNALDLIFMWFSSDSILVVLPFCVMVFSVCIMFAVRLIRGGK